MKEILNRSTITNGIDMFSKSKHTWTKSIKMSNYSKYMDKQNRTRNCYSKQVLCKGMKERKILRVITFRTEIQTNLTMWRHGWERSIKNNRNRSKRKNMHSKWRYEWKKSIKQSFVCRAVQLMRLDVVNIDWWPHTLTVSSTKK